MCNTKCNDKPCCHEEDLMCCAPVMHCCGGYSEHNNCCPHDRGCCNCCGCCPCCCHLKKKVEDIQETLDGDNGIKDDIENIKGDINRINNDIDILEEKHDTDIENIDERHTTDIQNINNEINIINNEIDDLAEDSVAKVEYLIDSDGHWIVFKNKAGDILYKISAEDFIKDGMLSDVQLVDYEGDKALKFIFNTDSGKTQPIYVPIGDLFELDDYYTKPEIDQKVSEINQTINNTKSQLISQINAEVTRATNAEQELSRAITTERNRATAAEGDLGDRITAEVARATEAERNLGIRITNEIAAEAARADAALNTAIDGLDSSTSADNSYALRGIIIENGKIKSNTQIKVPTNNNELVNGKNYQDATQVQLAIERAIDTLDSIAVANDNHALKSVVINNGKIISNTQIKVPTDNNELANGRNYQNESQVSDAIQAAIGNLDSNIPTQTNKAIASVTEENGVLSGTYTDTIAKAISDGGGRNIVNTYIDTITTGGNKLHYHTGAGTTDITIPYSVKASQDENGDVISSTYLKIAGAATDADATLQSASRTKIATVANTDLHVSLPRLVDNISLTLDPATYKIAATLKGGNVNIATSNEIDLPLETMVVSGSYDDVNKKIILTLKNGQTVSFSVADLIAGLVNTNDSRLSDARPASDVYDWAKAQLKPSYSWTEITNKPTIPDAQIQSDWTQNDTTKKDFIKHKPTLATVATSGSYDDLSNKPTIPAAQVNADWNASSGVAKILNKPTLFSGDYNDLTNKPTIPSGQIQADWNQGNSSQIDYIKNKPTVVSAFTNDAGYITSAEVPAQQQVNWNATSGVTSIANKPNLATVATSGSYNDLSNKPSIPTVPVNVSAFANDAGYITSASIPSQVQSNWTQTDNQAVDYIRNKPEFVIDGDTYNLEQTINNLINRITTIEGYWKRVNGTLTPVTVTDTVTAPAFYDSSVN